MHEIRGAGGTEGGIATFFIGFAMAVAGGWLLTNQVTVTSGYWQLWGYNAFGSVKTMRAALLADETYRQRFLREAQLATQIHHPNVAVMHDFSILPDGTSYMVAEFIDGTTVRQWQLENGRLPLALATEIAMQVLAGLDHVHRRGLLHRDVSAD